MDTEKPTPQRVKELRAAAGLTQAQAAETFGYPLRTWQRREEDGSTNTPLRAGEFQFLLLLAAAHPKYVLAKHL